MGQSSVGCRLCRVTSTPTQGVSSTHIARDPVTTENSSALTTDQHIFNMKITIILTLVSLTVVAASPQFDFLSNLFGGGRNRNQRPRGGRQNGGAGEIAEETIDPIIGSEDKIFLFHGKSDVLRSHSATEKTSVGQMG